ncbi:hypothetical protein ES702_01439 [subsurface metagenome]
MNLLETISSMLFFLILFWLVFAGTTTFSGEWIPPPIIIKFICWLCGINKDKEKEN